MSVISKGTCKVNEIVVAELNYFETVYFKFVWFIWTFSCFIPERHLDYSYVHSFPDSLVGKEPACNARDPSSIPGSEDLLERDRLPTPVFLGFPCASAGKEPACNAGDLGLIPGLGRSPWRRERLPTPVFLLGEFRGWAGYSPWDRRKLGVTEHLSLRPQQGAAVMRYTSSADFDAQVKWSSGQAVVFLNFLRKTTTIPSFIQLTRHFIFQASGIPFSPGLIKLSCLTIFTLKNI